MKPGFIIINCNAANTARDEGTGQLQGRKYARPGNLTEVLQWLRNGTPKGLPRELSNYFVCFFWSSFFKLGVGVASVKFSDVTKGKLRPLIWTKQRCRSSKSGVFSPTICDLCGGVPHQ